VFIDVDPIDRSLRLHSDRQGVVAVAKRIALVIGGVAGIAGACGYLISDEAGYATGQIIGVSGGRYI
jgi:hypothetical protein